MTATYRKARTRAESAIETRFRLALQADTDRPYRNLSVSSSGRGGMPPAWVQT